LLETFAIKERDNHGIKPEKSQDLEKQVFLKAFVLLLIYTALEDNNSLNSLSYNQLVHSGRGNTLEEFHACNVHAVQACYWDEFVDSLCAVLP